MRIENFGDCKKLYNNVRMWNYVQLVLNTIRVKLKVYNYFVYSINIHLCCSLLCFSNKVTVSTLHFFIKDLNRISLTKTKNIDILRVSINRYIRKIKYRYIETMTNLEKFSSPKWLARAHLGEGGGVYQLDDKFWKNVKYMFLW